MEDYSFFADDLLSYGVSMSRTDASRYLKIKAKQLDSIPTANLPRVRFGIGSSPVIYLTVDVAGYRKGRSVVDTGAAKELCQRWAASGYLSGMTTRQDVASMLQITEATVSRRSKFCPMLIPSKRGVGRTAAEYSVENIINYILSHREVL